ncbi:MAG: CHASE domain-containing protein, partial [Bacteroidetes bacterium]|nr:CHASE domain-containing protein [Bacteroidota bacterium]
MRWTYIKNFIRTYFLAFLVALLLLAITLIVFIHTSKSIHEQNNTLFSLRVESAEAAIEKRMQDYIQILKGCQALFSVSDSVSREEWADFVTRLQVDRNYPGIQGLGYAQIIGPGYVKTFEERIRESGFPDFTIWPVHERQDYTAIIYLEPFDSRNQRAFGYDMFTNSVRRKAMERARDTGKPSISSIVRLVQETENSVQHGFNLYMPLYDRNAAIKTVQQRRAAIKGFIYAPFRINDLMHGILRNRFEDLDVEIYDGPIINKEKLLFDSENAFRNDAANDDRLFSITPIRVAGHTWQLYIMAMPDFGESNRFSWFVLGGGILFSTLVFIILYSLTNVKRLNYLRQLITDNTTAALIILDVHDNCTFFNPATEHLLGYSAEDFANTTFHKLAHYKHPDGTFFPPEDCPIIRAINEKNSIYNLEFVLIHKNGGPVQVIINTQPIYEGNRIIAHLLEMRDIGPEKQAENKLLQKNKNLQTLNNVGKNLSAELELNKLIQLVTDSCTELTGAEYGAFFYNFQDENGENLMLYSLSGADHKQFSDFPMPRATAIFAPTLYGNEILRSDDITQDERYGKNGPFNGMPNGHFPVKSYLAVPVISRNGEVLGGLFFGHSISGIFTDQSEDIVKGIAAQAAIAIDNSRLFETINQKNDELIKINNDLDNFVYTASHDLKAPVLNIEGLVLALTGALEKNKPERIREILPRIQLSIKKFKETIQALTEVARVNKNPEEDLEIIQLRSLLKDVLFSIDDMVQESRSYIKMDLQQEEIHFSASGMKSILHNLLTNAIKYRSPDRPPSILVSSRKEDERIILEISDNGLGIDKGYLPKIFT